MNIKVAAYVMNHLHYYEFKDMGYSPDPGNCRQNLSGGLNGMLKDKESIRQMPLATHFHQTAMI